MNTDEIGTTVACFGTNFLSYSIFHNLKLPLSQSEILPHSRRFIAGGKYCKPILWMSRIEFSLLGQIPIVLHSTFQNKVHCNSSKMINWVRNDFKKTALFFNYSSLARTYTIFETSNSRLNKKPICNWNRQLSMSWYEIGSKCYVFGTDLQWIWSNYAVRRCGGFMFQVNCHLWSWFLRLPPVLTYIMYMVRNCTWNSGLIDQRRSDTVRISRMCL